MARAARSCWATADSALLQAPPQQYGLIVLDAFSSDAIPVHLLTSEALTLYLTRLSPGGAIAFHVSNRHLSLARCCTDWRLRTGWWRSNNCKPYHMPKKKPVRVSLIGSSWPEAGLTLDRWHPIRVGTRHRSRRRRRSGPTTFRTSSASCISDDVTVGGLAPKW